MTEDAAQVVRIERTFDSPAEDVFDAWTSEEVIRRWFIPAQGWQEPSAEVDLRLGGTVRVVADEEDDIIAALDALRKRYTYVFTTGGIGPTHDDITADSVAKAFGVGIDHHPEVVARFRERWTEQDLNDLLRKYMPKNVDVEDLRVRFSERCVHVTGIYPFFFPVRFETIWEVGVESGHASARLASRRTRRC